MKYEMFRVLQLCVFGFQCNCTICSMIELPMQNKSQEIGSVSSNSEFMRQHAHTLPTLSEAIGSMGRIRNEQIPEML